MGKLLVLHRQTDRLDFFGELGWGFEDKKNDNILVTALGTHNIYNFYALEISYSSFFI